MKSKLILLVFLSLSLISKSQSPYIAWGDSSKILPEIDKAFNYPANYCKVFKTDSNNVYFRLESRDYNTMYKND